MAGIADFRAPIARRSLYTFNMTAGGDFLFQLPQPQAGVVGIRFRTLFYTNSNSAAGGTQPWDGLILDVMGFTGNSYYIVPNASPSALSTRPNHLRAAVVLPLVPSYGSTNTLTWNAEEFPHIIPAHPIVVDSLHFKAYLQQGTDFPVAATPTDITAAFAVRCTIELLSA